MKLKNMTDSKLHKLIDDAQSELAHRKSKGEAIRQAQKMLAESGLTLEEVFGNKRGTLKGSKVPPKYYNKKDKNVTWSGRGKEPKWVKESGALIRIKLKK